MSEPQSECPVSESLADAAPLPEKSSDGARPSASAPANEGEAATSNDPVGRRAASAERSPEPSTRPGTALGGNADAVPLERKESVQQKPVIISKRPSTAKLSSSRRPQPKKAQPRGPPLPKEVELLKNMSARERIEYGYRMLRESNMSRGTAAFSSNLPRDPYDLHEERIITQQQVCKRRMEEERHKQLVQQYGERTTQQRGRSADRCDSRSSSVGSGAAVQKQQRSSSWARDTTPRGNFTFNWTAMPQCVPRRYIDPTPGPGAYTPVLHYVGGTH